MNWRLPGTKTVPLGRHGLDCGPMSMQELFQGIYAGRKVLVTGHTGFKGSWLTYWLSRMGANVLGYALEPETTPNHVSVLASGVESVIGDILDLDGLMRVFTRFQPEIVFHLAAQSLVRRSYREPVATFATNVLGTVHVLEACRLTSSTRAMVNITSDKCYENREWVWGYRENDPMGGYDPYSASKGCAELVTASYRNSFFNPGDSTLSHHLLLASARAGNVIGGGDWASDRIVTDMVVATSQGIPFVMRNPKAVRPWQHVLEPLSGYLLVGQLLLKGKKEYAGPWNFGPDDTETITVLEVMENMQRAWPKIRAVVKTDPNAPHEAALLKLDCSKAHTLLKWRCVWDAEKTFARTAAWYKSFYEENRVLTSQQLDDYVTDAGTMGICWAK